MDAESIHLLAVDAVTPRFTRERHERPTDSGTIVMAAMLVLKRKGKRHPYTYTSLERSCECEWVAHRLWLGVCMREEWRSLAVVLYYGARSPWMHGRSRRWTLWALCPLRRQGVQLVDKKTVVTTHPMTFGRGA